MRKLSARLGASAALFASAAGIATLGAVVAPSTASAATPSARAMAARIVPHNQLSSFCKIISHESGWNVHAVNKSSGAYGLAQALPASKMASAGKDWRNNPATQIRWALNYMNQRYGSPNAAWAHWQTHHSY